MFQSIFVDEMKEDEKETVRSVLIESYKQYEHEYTNPLVWKEYLKNIYHSVDNPLVDKILVAKNGEDILGTLQLFQSSENAYGRPELQIFSPIIRLLAVLPQARGRGVAQELIKAGIGYAKAQGAVNLYLHSSDKMYKAIQLYEWLGFKREKTKEFQNHDILVKCFRLDL
ncbi:GNAT family N-acetyltransferase [Bacillus sp. 03113]|uniref:GNAT family N-acetyltransferase n=1 Tax=Bacillus sp. 03113 TaxID=2578211 RepID=UPI001143B920|nr:GNAT family N-acetyltransferase [Bacillus sp. 03113]